MTTIKINGETATITKRHGSIVVCELRKRPMVKRPLGMFYEKRIMKLPFTTPATQPTYAPDEAGK